MLNRKEAVEGKLFEIFDLAMILNLSGSRKIKLSSVGLEFLDMNLQITALYDKQEGR